MFPLQHSLCLTFSQIPLLISAWSSMCAAHFTAQGPNYIFQLCSRLPQSKIKPNNVHFLATTLGPLGAVHDSLADKWAEGCLHPSTFPRRALPLSSLLFLCIRQSFSTQVHLTSSPFANCPLESTKMNPSSAEQHQLWQQMMSFALPFLLLHLHPASHSSGRAPAPANVERSTGTKRESSKVQLLWEPKQLLWGCWIARGSPQRCHHNSVTTTAKTQQGGEVKKGFKCKGEEEKCSPRIPCSSKPKVIPMRNAFPRQPQWVCLREVHILSPTKFHGAFHGA